MINTNQIISITILTLLQTICNLLYNFLNVRSTLLLGGIERKKDCLRAALFFKYEN